MCCFLDGYDFYFKYVNDWLSVVVSLNKIDEFNGFMVFVLKKFKIYVWFLINLGNMVFVYLCNIMFCFYFFDDNVMFLRVIKRFFFLIKVNDRFIYLGYEWFGLLFLIMWVNLVVMLFISLLDSFVIFLWLYCKNNILNDWGLIL